MNILFTLCGRAGTKSVKSKNIRQFCGKLLPLYSLSAIELYCEKYINDTDYVRIALSTDSPELIDIITGKRDDVFVINRDTSLSGDVAPKVSVIRDCLIKAEEYFNRSFDVVVDLDFTSPLRTVEDIKHAIDKKLERDDTDVVYSVTHSRRNPYFNMVRENNGLFERAVPSEYTTRQQAPVFYEMNASIYAYSPESLKNKNATTFFNDNCDAIIMKDTGILDIDSEDDYELLQVIAAYLFSNHPGFKEVYDNT